MCVGRQTVSNWSTSNGSSAPAGRRGRPVDVRAGGGLLQELGRISASCSDEELVTRSAAGDADSFNQLITRWERPIYALAYRVIGREQDARDVCQETFLRAFRGIAAFKGQAKFSSWLYRIALNLCRDWIRRERRTPVVQAPEGVDLLDLVSERGPAESVEDLVSRRDISRLV